MYHIIINPNGGKGKSLKALKVVEEKLKKAKAEYVVHETERAGHATEIARELSKEPNTDILMMGGDGTYYEILNGIENFENVTLGFIPCGSGNDFVKASGHPSKFEEALDVVLKGNKGYIDFIQLDDRRCINVLGAGMDVDVLLKYASMTSFKPGKPRYYASFFSTIAHTKYHHFRISLDGKEAKEVSVFMIGIGNGQFIGGGLPICYNAKVDDGKLRVVYVEEMNKALIPFRLPFFLNGKTFMSRKWVNVFDVNEIELEVLDDSQFEADGEIFGGTKIHCKVVSNKLRVFK